MIVREEYDNPEFVRGELVKVDQIKRTLFDERIDNMRGELGNLTVSKTSDDGFRFLFKYEDEFMNASMVEIILTGEDVKKIKELETKGLL